MASRILVALRVAASPERAFEVFTTEIGVWWQPTRLFQFTARGSGRLSFEPELNGRLVETFADGATFEVGRITVWHPPSFLAFTWRQATFKSDQVTEVHVRFEPAGAQTRVTVEHLGWDAIPQEHVARHTFPNDIFLLRHAEWWQTLLDSLSRQLNDP